MSQSLRFSSMSDALEFVEKMQKAEKISIEAGWSLYKTLAHCSQSIEYSMGGYPENQNRLFQMTIGKLVFRFFSLLGFMLHPLDAPLPGAPEIPIHGNIQDILKRLHSAIATYDSFNGRPSPHFTYGKLSKSQFAKAHCMHMVNHFKHISIY